MTEPVTTNKLDGVYCGLAGIQLEPERYDLGDGIVITQTYAHLMAHFIVATKRPASPGQPHPAPWHTGGGGITYDVVAQIQIPEGLLESVFEDIGIAAGFFAKMLRLRATSHLTMPLLSALPFAKIVEGERDVFRLFEAGIYHRPIDTETTNVIQLDDLDWIKAHWKQTIQLSSTCAEFRLALTAFDGCHFQPNNALALISLWGALESLFVQESGELSFRASAYIASFLEAAGSERLRMKTELAKLYSERSKAAHGGLPKEGDATIRTYRIVRRVLQRMIEDNRIPNRDDLEGLLFGSGETI